MANVRSKTGLFFARTLLWKVFLRAPIGAAREKWAFCSIKMKFHEKNISRALSFIANDTSHTRRQLTPAERKTSKPHSAPAARSQRPPPLRTGSQSPEEHFCPSRLTCRARNATFAKRNANAGQHTVTRRAHGVLGVRTVCARRAKRAGAPAYWLIHLASTAPCCTALMTCE